MINPKDPFRLQTTSLLVTRGAGGRGEALRSAPTPQGYRACQCSLDPGPVPVRFFRFLRLRWVRPCRRPLQKVIQKVIKNPIRKLIRLLTPNGLPKGPSKFQKSVKICKMGFSNTFRELFWPLSFQKWFPSRLQGPPEFQKL